MSATATPTTRQEFTRSMRALIATFLKSATTDGRKVLERMDAELRFGDPRVFDHLYRRYVYWHARQSFDSAAVRVAEGEYFNDTQHAIAHGLKLWDAIEARAAERKQR